MLPGKRERARSIGLVTAMLALAFIVVPSTESAAEDGNERITLELSGVTAVVDDAALSGSEGDQSALTLKVAPEHASLVMIDGVEASQVPLGEDEVEVLVVLDDGADTGEVLRGVVHPKPPVPPSVENQEAPPVSYLTDGEHVVLSWEPIDGVSRYEVRRDGETLATTSSTVFEGPIGSAKDRVEFLVWAVADEADSEMVALHEQMRQDGVDLSGLPEDAAYATFTFGVIIDRAGNETFPTMSPKEISALEAARFAPPHGGAVASVPSTTIRMRTFIKNKYVSFAGLGCLTTRVFGGDNRGHHAWEGTNRTRVDFLANWNAVASGWSKSRGPSKTYRKLGDGTYQLVETRYASLANLTSSRWFKHDFTALVIRMNHDVSNPYCPLGVVIDGRYKTWTHMRKGGYYRIHVTHDRYPSWSWYYKKSTRLNFDPIFYWGQGNPICVSACISHSFDIGGVGYDS